MSSTPPPRRPLTLRQLHSYVGMLIAPTVLFMAISGVLQVYSLHEDHGDYVPPAFVEAMGRIHKDQVLKEKHHDHDGPPRGEKPAKAPAAEPPVVPDAGPPHEEEHERGPSLATNLLKAFFALVGVGLITSTLIGLWMGLRNNMRWKSYAVTLAVGAVVPLVLALLTG